MLNAHLSPLYLFFRASLTILLLYCVSVAMSYSCQTLQFLQQFASFDPLLGWRLTWNLWDIHLQTETAVSHISVLI
jgi:hypothetical protein